MPDRAADSGLRCLGCDRSAATLSDLITYCPRARHENCPAAAARRSEVGDDFAGLAALALHKNHEWKRRQVAASRREWRR